jgi:hypothetical protein
VPVAGVTVALYKRGNLVAVDTQAPTTDSGAFAMTAQDTGLVPYDGYLKATKADNRDSYVYPPSPFIADQADIPVLMLAGDIFGFAVQFLMGTQDAGNGAIGTAIVDCSNTPIDGATLSVTQNGAAVGNTHDAGLLAAQAAGVFLTFNVPPGETVITATYTVGSTTHTWRPHTVTSFADATTTTIATP